MGLIARELVCEEDLQGYEWTEVSVVFGFDSRGRVNEVYGFAYGPGDLDTPIAPFSGSEVPVNAYREYMRADGDKGFIKMLFQFNRVSRRVRADFEYEDDSRWAVTPNNLDLIVRQLKPNLD